MSSLALDDAASFEVGGDNSSVQRHANDVSQQHLAVSGCISSQRPLKMFFVGDSAVDFLSLLQG